VGASQGFCPHCQNFLKDKGITKIGTDRETFDQVWYSPEHYSGVEKMGGASYPWAFYLVQPGNIRTEFKTKADHEKFLQSQGVGQPRTLRSSKNPVEQNQEEEESSEDEG